MKRGPVLDPLVNETLPLSQLAVVLDLAEQSILIVDRSGRILLANICAKQLLESQGVVLDSAFDLFSDFLHANLKEVLEQVEDGDRRMDLKFTFQSNEGTARVQWLSEPDWLVVRLNDR